MSITPSTSSNTLTRWGLVAIEGEDAVAFTHNQLSNDLNNLPENKLRLAALCSPKGRMIATMLAMRRGQQVLLLAPTDVLSVLTKRLSMFVLRSRCTVRNAHAQLEVGFVPATCTPQEHTLPNQPMHIEWKDQNQAYCTLWASSTHGLAGLHIRPRSSMIAPTDHKADEAFETHLWGLGLPYVSAAIQEMFVPQQLNWDLVGGVSFDKGCYPGQEIVARTHYLGKIKRRCFLAQAPLGKEPLNLSILAGMDVWGSGIYAQEEPIGQVATVTQSHDVQFLMLELPCAWVDEWLNTPQGQAENTPEVPLHVRFGKHTVTLHNLRLPAYNVHEKGYALAI